MHRQSGFAHIFLLLLIFVAIGIGVYLVQTRTNLLPFASENDPPKVVADLTTQILEEKGPYQSANVLTKNFHAEKIKRLSTKRKNEMAGLAQSNPAAFLSQIKLLGKESELPPETNSDIEKQIEVTGVLKAVHGDNFQNHESGPLQYYLEAPEVKKSSGRIKKEPFYKVHFVNPPQNNVIGSTVIISGIAIDSTLVVETGDGSGKQFNTRVEDKKVLGVTNIAGEQKVALVLINFQDYQDQPITQAQARGLMFSDPNSVDKYFREVSFNKATLSGDVYGWITLPMSSSPCQEYAWGFQADNMLRDSGVNIAQYKYIIYAFPTTGCYYGGLGELGPSSGTLHSWINYPQEVAIYKHELGHNFGVHHANALVCNDPASTNYVSCENREYGDSTDIMGFTFPGGQFNGPHKAALGWVGGPNIIEAGIGTTTYTLYNLETLTNFPQVLKTKTPYVTPWSNASDYYYFSYRQPIGIDTVLPVGITSGASIHLWDENPLVQTKLVDLNNQNNLWDVRDASLSDGLIFNDPTSRLKVKQISHDTSKAVIEVEQGALPTGTLTSNTPECNIPIGSQDCQVTLNWTTQNATEVKVFNRKTEAVLAIGPSGSMQTSINEMTYFDLYAGSLVLGTVSVFVTSTPEAPVITLNVDCIGYEYMGDGIKISWRNPYNPISYVQISSSPEPFSPVATKFVGGYPTAPTETTAPDGFSTFSYDNDLVPLKLYPDTTYYVSLSNSTANGPTATFTVPLCQNATPPPPTPPPSLKPTPTPKTKPTPSPIPSPTPTMCNPRPNIGRSTQMTPEGLVVNLTAAPSIGKNPMSKIQLTGMANGTVTFNGKTYTSPITFTLPADNAYALSLLIKQVTYGQATNISMIVTDECGPYSLFFGGGTGANWPKI